MAEEHNKTMAGKAKAGGWRGKRWRIVAWSGAVLILLLPLTAMQFTDEVNWGVGDFVLAGILLFGTGFAYELAVRQTGDTAYRTAVGAALTAAFILVWLSLGVGIIGMDGGPANLMYFGVLAVGTIGAILARLRPEGMARALLATALAQALVGAVALAAGLGVTSQSWPLDVIVLTGFFVALFGGAAWLFQRAAHKQPDRGTSR